MDTKYLVGSRKRLRTSLTKFHQKIASSLDSIDRKEKLSLLAKLEKIEVELDDLDKKVLESLYAAKKSDSEVDEEHTACEEYNTKLLDLLISLRKSLNNSDSSSAPGNSSAAQSTGRLKLPTIELPEFSNAPDKNLHNFFSTFENIVQKFNLNNQEKFLLLQGRLKGSPLTLINSLNSSDRSYSIAKELLENAFASKIVSKYDAIRRLADLCKNQAGDVYSYVGQMRIIQDLQSQLISITNNNKLTLNEINKNIFKAIDRVNEIKDGKGKSKVPSPSSSSNASNSLASNINLVSNDKRKDSNGKLFCKFCLDSSAKHGTWDCTKYTTNDSKRDKLKELNACLKCACSHRTEDCHFKFGQKCKCGQWHFSFLCGIYTPNKGKKKEKNDSPESRGKS
jgi:hypothetical protein